MKSILTIIFLCSILLGNLAAQKTNGQLLANKDSIPNFAVGNFMDDYGIKYSITDSVWTQLPKTKYYIIKWNAAQQYLIAKNDTANKSDKGLYTRIDYMQFQGMEPFRWGFCLTAYDATSDSEAEATAAADRKNPRKGCNGFPFSRMKKTE